MRHMIWRQDKRRSVSSTELQLEILQAVKAAPDCENLIDVFVQPTTPKSHLEPNWEVRGVRFGKADRKVANETLAAVVARLQRKFRVSATEQRAGPDGCERVVICLKPRPSSSV
jgi:hypothetical protein